jgi:teichuronic acid biosynthesis glycosyltransferase TuaH
MNNFDIVIVAVQSWDFEIGSNARNIALEFAKNHRVLYVNPPLDWISWIRRRNDKSLVKHIRAAKLKENNFLQVEPNIWNLYPDFIAPSINWISAPWIHDFLNKKINNRFSECISRAIKDLSFESYVLFNDNMIFKSLYLKELLQPSKFVYYIRDFLVIQPYFKKHGTRLEPQLMGKADVVVANSPYLKEYAEEFNQKSFYVGQGCEVEMFDEDLVSEIPMDVSFIQGAIIGYVGFLTSMRLDIDLLVDIATENPEWNLILVGPEDEEFQKSPLHHLKNVFFLGRKNPDQLPAYIKSFNVCINPQIVNKLTIGNYPRKVDEYLAMGKPVVATKTKAMEIFSRYVHLAENSDEFIELTKLALSDNDSSAKRERIAFAKSHTWKNSVDEIYKAIASQDSVKKSFLLILIVLGFSNLGFGQEIEYLIPEKLGVEINSEGEELNPLLSTDGKTLFFARAMSAENIGGKMAGTDIWLSQKNKNNSWLPSARGTKAWNNRESNAVIGVRANNTVYLLNAYFRKSGIAFSKPFNSTWTAPDFIPIEGIEKSSFVGFYMDPTFSIFLASMKRDDSIGEEDLYVSTKDSTGIWSKLVNLGPTINSDGFEISPFLSSDGKRLYFSSNGHDGLGDADIFVSTRLYDSWTIWTKPRNLQSPINSEKFDAYYSTYGDTISFFVSNRDAPFADIYQCRIKPKLNTDLKDSVSRIVAETQKLLADINRTNSVLSADIENVLFKSGLTGLSSETKNSIDSFLRKYEALALEEIEIVAFFGVNENETAERLKNLINYFVFKGITRDKIKIKKSQEGGISSNKNIFQIEFYVKK